MSNEVPTNVDRQSTPLIPAGTSPDPAGRPQTGAAGAVSTALPVSRKQLVVALFIAALSDAISFFATPIPPVAWAVDLVTAVLLFAVLGWRWLLLPGLILEAIPGVGVVPIWLLVVVAIALWGSARPNLKWLQKTDGAKP